MTNQLADRHATLIHLEGGAVMEAALDDGRTITVSRMVDHRHMDAAEEVFTSPPVHPFG